MAAGNTLCWSVRVDPPLGGARNMARDHALAAALEGGAAALRLYGWEAPTVSFGRNEPARGLYDRELAGRRGVSFVRRPTGGRAVLHHRELTYAVAAPLRALGGARRAYLRVNAGLVRALRALGVAAELAPDPGPGGAPSRLDAGPCFQRAAPGEVTVGGRKLVGSAQVRIGGTLLQHGSLLLEPGQGLLAEVGAGPSGEAAAAAPAEPPTSLLEVLGVVPAWERLVEAALEGLAAELWGHRGESTAGGSAAWRARVDGLEETLLERYTSEAWTWRR